jgi:hypothetical protein
MPKFIAYHARTSAEHQVQFNSLSQQGYRMISLSVPGFQEHMGDSTLKTWTRMVAGSWLRLIVPRYWQRSI